MAGEHSRFATELNRLLEATSLPVEDVVTELNKYGFPVPQHTFSYWLQGYFLPRNESAFQLVAVLENFFGVSDNCLSDALLVDLSSGFSFVPGENVQAEIMGAPAEYKRFFDSVYDSVDWGATLIQKVVRDEVFLSADHKYQRHKVTVFARVPSVPNPTFFSQILHETGVDTANDEVFYDLSGITLKKLDVSEKDGLTIYSAQFALPDDVVPGDLHSFSYTCDDRSNEPIVKVGDRFVPWILDFHSCRVTFEGEVPQGVRYVTCEKRGIEEIEVPNDIPVIRDGNTVSISVKNFGNIVGYFEVPTPTP